MVNAKARVVKHEGVPLYTRSMKRAEPFVSMNIHVEDLVP